MDKQRCQRRMGALFLCWVFWHEDIFLACVTKRYRTACLAERMKCCFFKLWKIMKETLLTVTYLTWLWDIKKINWDISTTLILVSFCHLPTVAETLNEHSLQRCVALTGGRKTTEMIMTPFQVTWLRGDWGHSGGCRMNRPRLWKRVQRRLY